MKNKLTIEQIDAICAKYLKRSPKTFRERPVRNFLGSLPGHTSFSDDYANLQADARSYRWASPIVSAITEGIRLAHYGKR